MQPQTFGSVRIQTVVEQPCALFDLAWLLPTASADLLMEHRDWMVPVFYDPVDAKLLLSIHSYLIRTPRHTILFDTCCGNDKERDGIYPFHMLSTPYLENLAAAGVKPEDVDYVLCSHLHVDHIGWNTRLIGGKWVPTFPRAKHIICQREYDYWDAAVRDGTELPFAIAAYKDSVAPIIESGQAVIVRESEGVAALLGEEFRLFPLNGHTEGHTGLFVESGGRRALMTGDAIHSPIQFTFPDWGSAGETDIDEAKRSRRRVIETCTDSDVVLLTGHFPAPIAGRIASRGGTPKFHYL